jgi:hypothetical protein
MDAPAHELGQFECVGCGSVRVDSLPAFQDHEFWPACCGSKCALVHPFDMDADWICWVTAALAEVVMDRYGPDGLYVMQGHVDEAVAAIK